MWWLPHIIVVTTNRSPHDWYDYNARDDEKKAVLRRFTGAYRFDHNPEGIPTPKEVDIFDPSKFIIATPLVVSERQTLSNNYLCPHRARGEDGEEIFIQ